MKNLILALPLSVAICAILTFSACKKTETTAVTDDSVSAQDVSSVNNALDLTSDDAASAAGQVQSYSGKSLGGWWQALCGASIVDTTGRQLVITYDGSSGCFGIRRSGSVSITLSNGPWRNMNAILTIVYNNLVVTDLVTGASFTINGTHTITNETGGLAWKIAFGLVTNSNVKHHNEADITVSFPNGSQKTWMVNRSREWSSTVTGNNNQITVTVYSEAPGGVDVTGINRYGNQFTNTILTNIMADNNPACPYKPYQGKVQYVVANRSTTVLYGTDANGNPIGTPTICGLGYFITYVNTSNGHTETRFVGYWI
jgi:hypothetical protein